MSIHVFLPCRKGSERIPNKNTKDFSGIKGGLLKIKLDQLINTHGVDSIIVSSNDAVVLEFADKYHDSRIRIDERPEHLGSSTTSTDDLIKYVPSIIPSGHVLWTHVTSPFFDACDYDDIIKCYHEGLSNGFDSLMTVKELRGFIWNKTRAISYDRDFEKWPRTQTIEPLYEINSAVFLNGIDQYKSMSDRIGLKPIMYISDGIKSMDIDWPDDFLFAEFMWQQKGRHE
ncbi:acylneuraminate cytidylyltransferase family protein [Aeromonas hydrophila]|uniref:acylneuraminate cytidylyltransferase family protein n=1 Tax=Aeromonas hydrophila TaxID=644 RepID=UPI001B3A18F9|nr:hypothetical protein [Aeromonas hydrophila]MBQ4677644.1 acylneuraminate cytidylyltransferase family protein [Aeromonas hydrophila]MBW3816248.1 acylneuraminate cytidylyltransferase family protein [Aeromonas hydrophila]MCF7676593.1 acylneuraminate cytidylyltransferase family protein [Aeromonas hydrophila]MCF7773327.1 acylneuraminate cytidylyltransferase family protein [Aeromonas hydrophila]